MQMIRRSPARGRAASAFLLLLSACFLRCILAVSVRGGGGRTRSEELQQPPFFEQTAANVSGFEGQTVYLPCRVRNLGDKVVSWIRSRDLHILSSGRLSFSSDPRFESQHLEGSDAWTLRLDRLRKSDAGGYECQVNTEPKIMHRVQLSVRDLLLLLDQAAASAREEPQSQQTQTSYESTAPRAAILGPRELRVQRGSSVSIRCLVSSPYQTRPVEAVHWLRDNRLLTSQPPARGGLSVETVAGTGQTFSEATLSNVSGADSGRYSCRPSDGRLDSILLHVHDAGDRAADTVGGPPGSAEAMQRADDDDDEQRAVRATSAAARSCAHCAPLGLLLLLCCCLRCHPTSKPSSLRCSTRTIAVHSSIQ